MRSVFESVARPVTARFETLKTIRHQMDSIPDGKVGALFDLNHCLDTHIKGGVISGLYRLLASPSRDEALQQAIYNGMFLGDIPATLAQNSTRQVLEALKTQERQRREEIYTRRMFSGMPVEPLHPDGDDNPFFNRLEIVYVTDYLAAVEPADNLRRNLTLSTLFGNQQAAMAFVADLRALPDYSEHVSSRRPRNGRGKKTPAAPARESSGWGDLAPMPA